MSGETKTTCPYCGVGCGVIAKVEDTKAEDTGAVSIKGDPDHPANFGRLCSKGSALGETLDLDGRALHPTVYGERQSWDMALDLVAERFSRSIAEHGPDSVAFYLSGQLLTEDYYVANKLMKGFIGSANIDTNSRLCMASSVAGHKRAFGSDTVPGTYRDLELADLVVLVGSNMGWCHPVLYQRIAAEKAKRPGLKVVVIDPRRTATSDIADLHLSIRPDGDVALFNGLLAHLVENGSIDQSYIAAHTNGFADAFAAAAGQSLSDLMEKTGLPAMQLRQFFQLFAATEKTVTCYSQGVNQSSLGTDKVNAIINCHLATGRIGRPGMGPFSLTGQPNAMGGREVGGLANMLAAHMELGNPTDRDRVQRFWAAPTIADKPGLKAVEMFQAVADGKIKALWIMSTNPVVSMPDADAVRTAIAACPFVVVSDMQADTDTAKLAHVLLPAAGWGEKSGTVTNSERRISRQRAFKPAPGEARADWWQMAEVGRRMGFDSAFAYQSPADIFAEHAALSAFENNGTRDFDIGAYGAITDADYQTLAPFQWPQRQGEPAGESRFFANGGFYHPDGKARFITCEAAIQDRASQDFPLTLNTGRVRDQWHTMTRTAKSARLSAHLAEPFAEIHPLDAANLGIADAALVEISSKTGSRVIVRALLTSRQSRGAIFVPMHWTGETASLARVDSLVPSLVDPISGQPALKHVAIAAKPYAAKAYGFAVSADKPQALDASYWALAKAEYGWRLELAFEHGCDWENWARTTLAVPVTAEMISYSDNASGDVRLAFFDAGRLCAALFMASQPVAVSRNWASARLDDDFSDRHARLALIAGRPGAGQIDPGAIVCSCFSVGINQITTAVRGGCCTVEAVGQSLSAGTNCGSCRAEIRRIIDAVQILAAE
ncbi:nitrate reductase [Agrobacterium vitis]|uniref:Nitrate reductase n=1 Tax=Agrobacterium vitis TaxID=373 RepID=A0A368P1S0_AGRVI|nr:nitrate reductase [Agrobacterium vitis]KAA3518849.1 nitrate reductase [Agrobacterium vitis]KAA3530447.1 nitrate reductase [Agrobacterium vitis]MCF1476236.1 nitrate reductase [Agrobacterium vitis]MUZ98987.1 molybdopterin-dependent oxidoreductase [Agrobacterium vitis]MVA31456.1 molybdopterin-dependent oxidoreductase [Agrobacterium vitis]